MSFIGSLIDGGNSNVVTPDLLKDTSKPITNTDYFDIVITNLNPNTSYNVQFAWVYPDDTRSDYSSTYTFTTSLESAPAIPSTPSVSSGPGLVNVTWNGDKASGGALTNYAKVNIYINGILKDFFLSAGTKSIALAKGTYSITLRSSSSTNVISDSSISASATVTTDATDAAAAQTSANSALSQLLNKLSIGAGVVANPLTQQLTDISLAQGIKIYTSAGDSGNRVILNSEGIAGWYGGQPMFSINTSTGNAFFKGEIGASRISAALTMDTGNSLRVGPSTDFADRSNILIRSSSVNLAEIRFNSTDSGANVTSHAIYASGYGLSIWPHGATASAMTFYGTNASASNTIAIRYPTGYRGSYSDYGSTSLLNQNSSSHFRDILFALTDPGAGSSAASYPPGSVYLVYEN